MDDKGVGAGEGRKTNKDTVMGRSNGRGEPFRFIFFFLILSTSENGGRRQSNQHTGADQFFFFDF